MIHKTKQNKMYVSMCHEWYQIEIVDISQVDFLDLLVDARRSYFLKIASQDLQFFFYQNQKITSFPLVRIKQNKTKQNKNSTCFLSLLMVKLVNFQSNVINRTCA